jgi:hypothetical protein
VAGLQVTFSIIGSIMLLFGLGFATWRLTMLLGWKRRHASVVSYMRQRAHRGSSYVRLTVRFEDEDGGEIEATDDLPWNTYHENQRVLVLVVPDSDPARVVVPEFLRFWLMSLIFVSLGTTFLYVALVYVPSLR